MGAVRAARAPDMRAHGCKFIRLRVSTTAIVDIKNACARYGASPHAGNVRCFPQWHYGGAALQWVRKFATLCMSTAGVNLDGSAKRPNGKRPTKPQQHTTITHTRKVAACARPSCAMYPRLFHTDGINAGRLHPMRLVHGMCRLKQPISARAIAQDPPGLAPRKTHSSPGAGFKRA